MRVLIGPPANGTSEVFMKKGFTLIEVLTVIVIVGILAAIALPQYNSVVEKSKFTKAEVMAKSLYDSCERYVSQWGVETYNAISSGKKLISRMDIGDTQLLPIGFSLTGNSIVGAGFSYTIPNAGNPSTGECYVEITRNDGNYEGAKVAFDGEQFICINNTQACETYGLKVVDE